ncbi:MAG: hypothetical protein NTW01_12825 [Gammaproteobacteria bacterium]|jgi:hypothetical protein|nr:hypothetical protein [Gammaproteobacteria bacterium]
MKQHVRSLLNLGAGLGLSLAAAPSFAGFEVLTTAGTPVLKVCQGTESNRNPTAGVCRVTGAFPTTTNGVRTFPGLGGNTWALYASNNNQAVIANGTEIGRLDDRVWRRGTSTDYVFGIRITLNNRRWQPPLATCGAEDPDFFEVNDLGRLGFNGIATSIAYRLDGADEGIWLAGRTAQGLNQYPGSPEGLNPARNNDYVSFRSDINFDDPDGTSVATSAWYFVAARLTTPPRTTTTANTIGVRQGGEEGQCRFLVPVSGLRP